jgi:hypothetical protein
MQAQDLPGVKWSVGLRAPQTSEVAVEAGFDAGAIVGSWPMRGTLHLVPTEDLGWMLELTAPRALRSAASRRAALGIDEADMERTRATSVASLRGGRALTRHAILAVIAAGGVSTEGQRGYRLNVWRRSAYTAPFSADRGVCFGARLSRCHDISGDSTPSGRSGPLPPPSDRHTSG